jgi:VHL beta domain
MMNHPARKLPNSPLITLFLLSPMAMAGQNQTDQTQTQNSARPLRSIDSSISTQIKFVNNLDVLVNIYWKDFNGDERFYNKLFPGESYEQRTFESHPWIIRSDDSGKVLLVVVATRKAQVVYIR